MNAPRCIWEGTWQFGTCARNRPAECPLHGDAAGEGARGLQARMRARRDAAVLAVNPVTPRSPEDAYEAFWAIVSDAWTADEYLDLVGIAALMDGDVDGDEIEGGEIAW